MIFDGPCVDRRYRRLVGDDESQMVGLTAQVNNADVLSWPLRKRTREGDRGG